jgi:hypothetical protein
MTDNYKETPDFIDLLFEKRNKEYGAYQLRKKYNGVVIGGLIIASLLFSLAVILPVVINPSEDKVLTGGSRYVQVQMENLDTPIEEIIIPPAPPPPEVAKIQEIVKYVPPVVVDSILTEEKLMATADESFNQPTDEISDFIGNGDGENLMAGDGLGDAEEPSPGHRRHGRRGCAWR